MDHVHEWHDLTVLLPVSALDILMSLDIHVCKWMVMYLHELDGNILSSRIDTTFQWQKSKRAENSLYKPTAEDIEGCLTIYIINEIKIGFLHV